MKKRYPVFAGLLSAVMLFAVACAPSEEGGKGSSWDDKDIWFTDGVAAVPTEAYVLPSRPNFGAEVHVHDPSIFYDQKTSTYYAFGTHYATASSKDLISWTQESSDNGWTKLYNNSAYDYNGVQWPKALQEAVDLVQPDESISTTWAPDVVKIGSTYYMYFSITKAFGSSASVIGRVSARSKAMGPYSNMEVIVRSEGVNGTPNCIDPELFYDKDGNLYMVYGSHAAGIYVKELDEKGLPVVKEDYEDGYFGTLVWKGGGAVVEGPFIFYNAETDYYYLMTSYGDLSKDYNMRVARSKDPMGPYEDIEGRSVAQESGHGNKLAGNYKFAGDSEGRAALGHNSVIKKDGKYLVVHHIRSQSGENVSGAHHLEVRQLFFNEDGWPVLAPNRWAGESAGVVTAEQAAGGYDIVIHSEGTTSALVSSVAYTIAADGTITDASGNRAGTLTLKQGYYAEIVLNNVTYKGVIAPGWENYGGGKGALTITATSDKGVALWANGK